MERREAIKNMGLGLGYTLSASTIASLMTACDEAPKIYWKPKALSTSEAASLEVIAEAILPKTDTPGANDLGVPKFIDTIVAEVMSAQDRKKFIEDLNAMMTECLKLFKKPFEKCSPEQQKELLDNHEASNPFQYPRIWGTPMLPSPEKNFFGKLKDLVVWAYFSTEFAGETLLAYDPVPGQLESCVPLDQVGKAWSLN